MSVVGLRSEEFAAYIGKIAEMQALTVVDRNVEALADASLSVGRTFAGADEGVEGKMQTVGGAEEVAEAWIDEAIVECTAVGAGDLCADMRLRSYRLDRPSLDYMLPRIRLEAVGRIVVLQCNGDAGDTV